MKLFPNPSDGAAPVNVLVPLKATGPVNLKLFTTAFRKIQEINDTAAAPGDYPITLSLLDKWGTPLANGLYYVVVSTGQERFISKLLVLR